MGWRDPRRSGALPRGPLALAPAWRDRAVSDHLAGWPHEPFTVDDSGEDLRLLS